ncbi:uclacyanin 1 [Gossypium raimondii]|uniref:Phytocyanin domain-containing protein n=1 Tax=Gossypium raimondii TaxID=29730 RepID=A0A0D2W3P3_GOSRA|nr:uclacyanin 1 [Gossypium raimondii]KJB79910.1 hypothetical protein B456_013G071700 [Gossypium raimondii]MBA0602304.1 hypothetical protein [Gossypium raimondii]
MARTLVCLAATAMLVQLAMAANYTVGGANGGWDSSTDLQTWAASQKFAVGDNLIFQYTPNHDLVEVTKADYDSCQTSSPIRTYTDGNTVVPLTSPGKRYFICGTLGHCSQGMQIEIDTLATSPTYQPSASPAPETSPSPAETPELALETSPSFPPSVYPAPETLPSLPPSVYLAPETSPLPTETPEAAPGSLSSDVVPSIESAGTSSSRSDLSQQPLPSSANTNSFRICLGFGFGLMLVVLLAL